MFHKIKNVARSRGIYKRNGNYKYLKIFIKIKIYMNLWTIFIKKRLKKNKKKKMEKYSIIVKF